MFLVCTLCSIFTLAQSDVKFTFNDESKHQIGVGLRAGNINVGFQPTLQYFRRLRNGQQLGLSFWTNKYNRMNNFSGRNSTGGALEYRFTKYYPSGFALYVSPFVSYEQNEIFSFSREDSFLFSTLALGVKSGVEYHFKNPKLPLVIGAEFAFLPIRFVNVPNTNAYLRTDGYQYCRGGAEIRPMLSMRYKF